MRGSLQRVKSKKGELVWRAQWREDGKGRTRILGKVREMGRAAAQAELDAIIAPLMAKEPAAKSSITLRGYIEQEYLPSKSSVWKLSTERTTEPLIQKHIVSQFGNRLLTSVSRKELQQLLDQMAETYAKNVVSHVRFQLRAIFEMAAGDGAITVNPTNGLSLPRRARKRVAPEIGDRDKISRAIMALELRDRVFVALCVWRGMRPGEVCALQVGDIRGEFIHVERRIYMGVVDDPKSDLGNRKVPIGALGEQLSAYVASLPDQRPEAWLFPSEAGNTPISAKNIYQRRLEPVFKAAGLTRFNFQAMRATWSTEFAEVEPDAKVRSDLAGHTVDVQEQVYRRSSDKQKVESIRRFDEGRVQ